MKTISIIKKIIVIAMIAFIAYMPESISAMSSRPLQGGGLLTKSAQLVRSLGSTGSAPAYSYSTQKIAPLNNDGFKAYMQNHASFKEYKEDPGLKRIAAERYAKGQGDYSEILNKIASEQFGATNPHLESEFTKQEQQNDESTELERLRNVQLQTNKLREEWAQESQDRMKSLDEIMQKQKEDREQDKADNRWASKLQEQWDTHQLPKFLRTAQ